jgi:geranylgeranyl pyrophosphate synthase
MTSEPSELRLVNDVDAFVLEQLAHHDPQVQRINAHLAAAPGKHIRAILVVLGSTYGDGTRTRDAVAAAAAVELLHLGSLVHDDVMDDADMRRGLPAVHRRWSVPVASLSGGYLCTRASSLVNALHDDRIRTEFGRTVTSVCSGQLMEIENGHNLELTEERYHATIERKTGALFAFAAFVGGAAGRAPEARTAALRAYGGAFGTLFQILDDILDVTGEAGPATKPAGNDLRRGTYTLPVLLALRAPVPAARELRALLGPTHHRAGDWLQRALALVRAAGGLEAALSEARRIGERAVSALAPLPGSSATRALRELVEARLAQACMGIGQP